MQISLNLTLEETNIILNALSQRPFAEVNNVIGKIQQQAQPQLEAQKVSDPLPVNSKIDKDKLQ